MAQPIVLSDADEILQPALHDAKVQGLLLTSDGRLLMPVEIQNGTHLCLVFCGIERLRVDDFRQGNIILDATVTSGAGIELEDIAYAYGVEPKASAFLQEIMNRLVVGDHVVARVNPSYGCALVCICREIKIEEDLQAALSER